MLAYTRADPAAAAAAFHSLKIFRFGFVSALVVYFSDMPVFALEFIIIFALLLLRV